MHSVPVNLWRKLQFGDTVLNVVQKHERQAQQHYQQLQRKKREEEERQRQAEHMARRERERDESRSDSSGDHHHDKSHSSKSRSGGGSSGLDKPKRPSSLLANNNVMKLKQIIPLQNKFSSGGARSPQSPTGSEPKLPGFLSFKFLKSPENKKEGAAASAGAPSSTHAAAAAASSSSSSSSSGSSSQERSLSPSKAFNPGKLFNFGKSEGGVCVNGATPPKSGDGLSDRPPSRSDLNCVPDEIPSPGGEGSENGHSADSDPTSSRA